MRGQFEEIKDKAHRYGLTWRLNCLQEHDRSSCTRLITRIKRRLTTTCVRYIYVCMYVLVGSEKADVLVKIEFDT